jgi:peptidoglycan hydrolase-like protein with peptidoglycan-binding domain
MSFGPDKIRVAPPTVEAWNALAAVLKAHGYLIRIDDTDSYNCRAITGGSGRSLHSYGIALDINWDTNPYQTTSNKRAVKFSNRATQDEREEDVKLGKADTDFTPAIIADVLAIKTKAGKRVFEWGGNWTTVKDTMHFEIDVTPADLKVGIDPATVTNIPSAPTPPPEVTYPEIKKGAKGDFVKIVQMALMVDGIFGAATEIAVKAFQKRVGLTPDGIVGPNTWREIEKAIEPPVVPVTDEGWQTNIKATVFGGALERQTSAYDGHVIGANEVGFSLPYRFPSPPRAEIRNRINGKVITAPAVDVGPWLIDDPYWTKGTRPEAETRWKAGTKLARGPNKGRLPNGAGIDLTPAAMKALGINGGEGIVDFRLL